MGLKYNPRTGNFEEEKNNNGGYSGYGGGKGTSYGGNNTPPTSPPDNEGCWKWIVIPTLFLILGIIVRCSS